MRHLTWVVVSGALMLSCSVDPVASFDGGGPGAGTGGGSGGAVSGSGGRRGTGGMVGTGGAPGTGGVVGTGGAPGTGGVVGTGGAPGTGGAASGSGGRAASGGATGTGGRAASGGATGSGGRGGRGGGTGGAIGSGGAPDGGTDGCDAIETQYGAALKTAEMCNPALNRLTCQSLVSTSLACSGCKVHVDTTDMLDKLQKQWTDAGCDKVPRVCPAIACITPGTGMCTVQADGTGSCLNSPIGTAAL